MASSPGSMTPTCSVPLRRETPGRVRHGSTCTRIGSVSPRYGISPPSSSRTGGRLASAWRYWRKVRSIQGCFSATNASAWRSAIRRGRTTSTPSGATTMRSLRARSDRLIVYSVTASEGRRRSGGSALVGYLVIDARNALGERRPRVALAAARIGALAHTSPLGIVGDHPHQSVGHRVLVVGRHQEAGLTVVDDRGRTVVVHRDHRQPAGHPLHQHLPELLVHGRQ